MSTSNLTVSPSTAAWLGLLCLMASFLQAAPARPLSVLFVGGCGFEVARKLTAAGFAVDACAQPEEAPLAWDRLKQYNVVVTEGLGRANADMTLNRVNTETIAALQRFVQEGGGVLVLPYFGQMVTQKPPQDAFLKPLGLTPLFDEWAMDPGASVIATPWKIPFARTDAITPSPITEGVHTLWYPVPQSRIGGQNHNLPLSEDGSWTVVLSGSPSSFTRSGPLQADPPTQPGHYAAHVPLAAIKQVGQGRLVYLGITPEYLFGANATTTLEGIVLEGGCKAPRRMATSWWRTHSSGWRRRRCVQAIWAARRRTGHLRRIRT